MLLLLLLLIMMMMMMLTCMCVCVCRLTRQAVKGNDAAVRQELEDAEMKVEQCKVHK